MGCRKIGTSKDREYTKKYKKKYKNKEQQISAVSPFFRFGFVDWLLQLGIVYEKTVYSIQCTTNI